MASSIKFLTIKSCRMIWRSQSMRTLVCLSSLIVFGSLYLMWFMSYGQTLKFMTSNAYTKLSFDLICAPGLTYQPGISECKPTGDNRPDGALSPADLLINLLSTGNILSDSNDPNSAHDFAGLLSSIMMNGAPMLGLDDFVHLSDFVNKNLGAEGRNQIMNSPAYSDKFGNFLDVRKRELRITPYSCWTESFLNHLNKNSLIAKDLHVIQYPSMNEAMKDCCDNVWAIVEIIGPSGGFECSLFKDTGGTQYLSPEPSEERCNLRTKKVKNIKLKEQDGDIDDKQADVQESRSSQNRPAHNTTAAHTTEKKVKTEESILNVVELRALMGLGPSITVRMLPSAVPDTRNFEWSPRKSGSIRQQSGQLLYFLSGFLSIQLEMQNFLSAVGLGGPLIRTQVLGESPEESFLRPHTITRDIAEALMRSTSNNEVYSAIINTTSQHREQRPSLLTPLYHRAFPTHRYVQQTYWHVYGSMITTALVVYFSLPAAVTAGAFRREVAGGQLDSLSTLPGLRAVHSAAGWYLCGAAWSTFSFLFCYAFFYLILEHTSAMVPALNLFLCGLSLGPLAIALGCVIKRADALVVTVPTFVFISMLPGLLYVDLAFDVQRSVWVEMLMCLLPPSAAALVLREVCALEALNISADWNYPAPISRTPVYAYTLVLLFDCILYCAVAAIFIEMNHRTNTPSISPPEKAVARRRSLWGSNNDGGRSTGYGSVHQQFYGSWREEWRTLCAVCGVIAGAVSQGVGYFWGCQVSTIPHSYSSLSQEQRACIDNYDVNFENNNFGLRSLKKVPKRSTSAHDMKSNSHFEHSLHVESGSRSVGDMDMDVRGMDGPRNRSTIESIDNGNTIGNNAHHTKSNSNRNNRKSNSNENRSAECLVVPQGIGPLPGTGTGFGTGAGIGPYMKGGFSMDVQGGCREGQGQGQGQEPQQIPQGFFRPLKACMRITDLRKEYVTARTGVVVLEEVSAELKQGTVTCLLGSNGAGKTTLLRILCGLDSQYTGSITLTESRNDDDDDEGEEDVEEESKQVDVSSSYARKKDEEGDKSKGMEVGEAGGREGMKVAGKGHVEVDDSRMQKKRPHQRDYVASTSSVMRDGVLESGPWSAASRRNRSSIAPLSLSFFPSTSSSTASSHSSPFTWSRDIAVSVVSFWIVTFAKARRFVTHTKRFIYPPKKARVRRSVGWCAQEDALFEYLTVREHIELFDDLLGTHETVLGDAVTTPTAPSDSNSSKENEIHNQGSGSESGVEKESEESLPKEETYLSKKLNQFLSCFIALGCDSNIENAQTLVLTRLGMVEHADKMACELSGGMKRRLALALAFAGTPKVLLLDEPSSGCDSWTRELVRKDIMLKKQSAAVLVSTHHIDDVEVLSDRVWFLNERYLAFNGPLDTLTELGSSSSFNAPTPSHDDVTRIAHTVLPVSLPRTFAPTATPHHKTTTQDMHTRAQVLVPSNTSPPTHPLSQYHHSSEGLLDAAPTVPQDNSMLVELQFFTWSESVMRKFREEFSSMFADAWLMDSSLICSTRSVFPEPFNPLMDERETLDRNSEKSASDYKSKNFYIWRVPCEHSAQLHRMLERLEGSEDSHWSVNSPNIYDALSAMYAPHNADTPGTGITPHSLSMMPSTASFSPKLLASPMRSPAQRHTAPAIPLKPCAAQNEEKQKDNYVCQSLIAIIIIMHTVSRQFYHILKMRVREVQSSLGQFLFTQTLLPFLVVLCVAVGCRDIRYPKVELTSKNTGGIGEVCVALGPQFSTTKPRTPISSPDGNAEAGSVPTKKAYTDLGPSIPNSNINKIIGNTNDVIADIEASSGLGGWKILLGLWKLITRWFHGHSSHKPNKPQLEKSTQNSTDSGYDSDTDIGSDDDESDVLKGNTSATHSKKQGHRHQHRHGSKNLTFGDAEARKQFYGYDSLLALLGRKTLKWVGSMNSDIMFGNMYSQYYAHENNRWASFIINDELEEWIESSVIIEQGSLNLSISSAFQEILRAQRSLCSQNTTSSSTFPASGAAAASASTSASANTVGRRYYEGEEEFRLRRDGVTQGQGQGQGQGSWTVGMNSTQRILTGDNQEEDEEEERMKGSGTDQSPHATICGKHPAIRIYHRKGKGNSNGKGKGRDQNGSTADSSPSHKAKSSRNNSSDDAIIVRSYEAMRSNVSMLSNVTTDHAAPVFLKEIAPAVYSSLLNISMSRNGSVQYGDENRVRDVYRSSSVPVYRLYSHPLPKINYTNQIYIERGYLGATMIVLYMLITTIVSVRAITLMRKNGIKLQLHMAGVHPVSYWCCNFLADSVIVQCSLISVFLAVMIGGEPIRDYFLTSSSFLQGGLFIQSIFAFSFAVVASSYAFSALSSDQLSSQLLMLVSTVAGGVFLKLYLDRHTGPVFGFITTVFLWFSPCFTFSTCMFDLFALRGTQMALQYGASVDTQIGTSVAAVSRCTRIMAFQVAFYLMATVMIDCYYARVSGLLNRIKFLLSLPLRSRAVAAKRALDAEQALEMRDYRPDKNRSRGVSSSPSTRRSTQRHSRSQSRSPLHTPGAGTPLKRTKHRSYSSIGIDDAEDDEDSHEERGHHHSDSDPDPDYPFTPTRPDMPLLFPGLIQGQGVKRVLREQGTVYGEIGGFPGVREIQNGVRALRLREREGMVSGSEYWSVKGGKAGTTIDKKSSSDSQGALTNGTGTGAEVEVGVETWEKRGSEPHTGSTGYTDVYDILVEADDLCVEYSSGSARKMALNGLTFQMKKGERVALLGMNGGGKSTLFKSLALAQNVPADGFLKISGMDVVRDQWDIAVKETMGYVAQEGGLPEFLTVEQTLDLFCGLHSIKSMTEDRADVNTLLCDVLQGLRSRYSDIMRCCTPGRRGHRSGAGDALDDIAGHGYSDIAGDGYVEGQGQGEGDVCLQVDGCDVISSSHIKHSISYQTGLRTDLSHSYDHVPHSNTASSSFNPTLAPSSASAPSTVPLPLPHTLTTPWGHLVGSSPTSILPPKYLSYPVHTLSGGNKKKLSVAISSINDPSFLAVDECTTGVDPLAAEKIVHHLRDLHATQGLLFASHRIDECITTCNRVVMLVEGRVYFDGSVHAFDQLATLFYQVDLVLSAPREDVSSFSSFSSLPSRKSDIIEETEWLETHRQEERSQDHTAPHRSLQYPISASPCPSPSPFLSHSGQVIFGIGLRCGGLHLLERVVEYSPTLVRLTFEKRLVPLTKVWDILGDLKRENVLDRYSFRSMALEEALATIIASSKAL